MKINLIEKIDCIKSNWYLWSATRLNEKNEVEEGSVQADCSGELIAEDSFEKN